MSQSTTAADLVGTLQADPNSHTDGEPGDNMCVAYDLALACG